MGIIAKGVSKQTSYKKETTWGTAAGTSGGKQIRRVTSSFNLKKSVYESAEIRTDYQVNDMRHGIRSVEGSLNGELSPGTYADFMGSVLAKDFASVSSIASLSLTITASGDNWAVARGTGSFVSDGVKVGQVVRLAAAGLAAGNVGKNLLVAAVSALTLTVVVINGSAMTAEGPVASCTMSFPGKYTYAPTTGHTDDSYTFEEWYADIEESEVYTGNKAISMAVSLPATGLVTTDFGFIGKDLSVTDTTQYFSTPTAVGTTGAFAAVNGVLLVAGAPVALVTSADFTVDRANENAEVVGSNSISDISTGRIRVTGNFSTYFVDQTFRDYFDDETEVSMVLVMTTSEANAADFVSFTLPRIKVGSADKNDGEGLITQSHSFTALLNSTVSAGLPNTTLAVHDSAAA